MKLSAFKNFQLFKPRTRYPCRQCHCTYRVQGDTWIEVRKPVAAVDGSKAFRVVWLCHAGHRQFRGYTKPVSWKKNLGGDVDLTTQDYAEQEEQEEKEFQELVDYARKMRDSGTGKTTY